MFSPEFMKFLIKYQKEEFCEKKETVKEIKFKNNNEKLIGAKVFVSY